MNTATYSLALGRQPPLANVANAFASWRVALAKLHEAIHWFPSRHGSVLQRELSLGLANARLGRVCLHALCLLRRPGRFRWHWQGMVRELTRPTPTAECIEETL